MLQFLNPIAFAWLLLALPIVALYLVVLGRRRKQSVAAMMLWERAIARRSPWTGLRRWLSLAAVLMLLALFVLALAEPFWGDPGRQGRTLMLVIDRTGSMTATDGRFDAALSAARAELDQLEPGDRAGVVSFGDRVVLHTPPSHNLVRVRELLDALTPVPGGLAAAEEAVQLAGRLAEARSAARIVVVTDGAIELSEPRDEGLAWHLVGDAGQNLAITRFVLRPAVVDGADDFVQINLRNLGSEPVSGEVSLAWEDQPRRVELAAGEEQLVLWPTDLSRRPKSGAWQASVTTADLVAGDNVATSEGFFATTSDSRIADDIRRSNEADLMPRGEFTAASGWPARGSPPTWLGSSLLAAAVVLMAIEFVLFTRGVFV